MTVQDTVSPFLKSAGMVVVLQGAIVPLTAPISILRDGDVVCIEGRGTAVAPSSSAGKKTRRGKRAGKRHTCASGARATEHAKLPAKRGLPSTSSSHVLSSMPAAKRARQYEPDVSTDSALVAAARAALDSADNSPMWLRIEGNLASFRLHEHIALLEGAAMVPSRLRRLHLSAAMTPEVGDWEYGLIHVPAPVTLDSAVPVPVPIASSGSSSSGSSGGGGSGCIGSGMTSQLPTWVPLAATYGKDEWAHLLAGATSKVFTSGAAEVSIPARGAGAVSQVVASSRDDSHAVMRSGAPLRLCYFAVAPECLLLTMTAGSSRAEHGIGAHDSVAGRSSSDYAGVDEWDWSSVVEAQLLGIREPLPPVPPLRADSAASESAVVAAAAAAHPAAEGRGRAAAAAHPAAEGRGRASASLTEAECSSTAAASQASNNATAISGSKEHLSRRRRGNAAGMSLAGLAQQLGFGKV